MKQSLILLMCLLVFPILADTTKIEALAGEFFRLNTPEQGLIDNLMGQADLMSPLMDSMKKPGEGSASSEEDTRKLLSLFFGEGFSYSELEAISIPIITSQYSLPELEAIVAFLKSPAGAAYIRNSAYRSNYLAQALQIYFERKTQDEDWLMGMLTSLFESFGLGMEDGSAESGDSYDWNWEVPAAPDTLSEDYWGDHGDWDTPAEPDTAYVDPDYSWDDYWDGPPPVTITMSGKIMQSLDEIRYIFNEIMPAFKQIYDWLDAYTEEYGGYPFELDWSAVQPVPGYDLEYDHDGAYIKAASNSSHSLPGVDIIYYLAENSVWISIPGPR